MGKGGAVLGIIALLIGAGGLGFGLLAWLDTNNIKNQINTWHDTRFTVYGLTPTLVYLTIPGLNINFTLESPTDIYISFTCHAGIESNIGGYSTITFYFGIDGVRLMQPYTRVGSYQSGSTDELYSVNLQHYIKSIYTGFHNITIIVITENTGNFVQECDLFAQSYAS